MYNLIASGLPTLDDGTGPGSKSANQEWFTIDCSDTKVPVNLSRQILIHFAISTDSVIEYTLDSGSNWVAFNNKSPLSNNTGYELGLRIRNGDLFNIRATEALTVIFARVDVVI